MKLLCIRTGAARLSLCAAIVCSTLITRPLFAEDPKGAEATQAPPSELYDADFAKHLDLRLLGIAWQSLDAKLMTDVGLQMREAENVLGRKHAKITSDQILEFAGKVAADNNDAATLERLARVAKAAGKADQVAKLKQIASLAANSRDLRGEALFSAEDVNNGALAAFANIVLQIRAAKVSGDKHALEDLKQGTDLLTSLRDSQRSQLKGRIDDAMDSLGDPDNTASLLDQLTGPTRDLYGTAVNPNASTSDRTSANASAYTTTAPTASGYTTIAPSPPSASAIIVTPPPPPPTSQTSYACSGMRYVMTPSGAVVQGYGRLGSIIFEPGDVILALGGYPLNPGTSVDGAVNAGYVSGYRSITVRDRNSGQVLNLFY